MILLNTCWIDHVQASSPHLVNDCAILYGTTFDDHIPLYLNLNVPCDITAHQTEPCDRIFQNNFLVLWDKVTREQIDEYTSTLEMGPVFFGCFFFAFFF